MHKFNVAQPVWQDKAKFSVLDFFVVHHQVHQLIDIELMRNGNWQIDGLQKSMLT